METNRTVNNATRYYVMAVTPTRLYSFTGIGTLDVRVVSVIICNSIIFFCVNETSKLTT